MSRVKANNTTPELIVRRFLHGGGLRYGLHNKNLPGKPDIVLRKIKTIIFVHGCFWHGHEGCNKARLPKTRSLWWKKKQAYNANKDAQDQTLLNSLGWRVITIWQCELSPKKREATLSNLKRKLTAPKTRL